jgi:hypothetical protein
MTKDSECIFIKLFRNDGKIVGHAVSNNADFSTQQSLVESKLNLATPSIATELGDLEKEFRSSVTVYLDYMPIVFDLAPILSSEAFVTALEQFLDSASLHQETVEDGTHYKIRKSSYSEFSKLASNAQSVFGVQDALTKNGIMGLVSTLDTVLASVIRLICMRFPESSFGKDSVVKVNKLLEAVDVASLKSSVIEDKVAEITRLSFAEQIEWIEKRTALDPIKASYAGWPTLGELYQRRHLFAHTNGKVSKQYIDCRSEYGYECTSNVGDEIGVGGDYYLQAVECVIEFTTKFFHVVKMKFLKGEKDLESEAPLNQFCFELLQRGSYSLASRLLNFAREVRGKRSDKLQKMITVNYANSLKLLDRGSESISMLDTVDWSSSSIDFLICVEAVRGNKEAVVDYMRNTKGNPPLSEDAYRDWPAFFHIRECDEFRDVYSEVFGVPYEPTPTRMSALSHIFKNLRTRELKLQISNDQL